MAAYYNEIDPYAAAWLRNLIAAGCIAPGDVDERSIEDVKPDDLRPYVQCHFFAGIGVWSYALRQAGWRDDRPVWTGSCPCQPFSAAGKGDGFADERHLWPHWYWLIQECGPADLFGEQVASKNTDPWVDLVHADLEALGYAFGCVPFPAAGIGAPHIRDRNYWTARRLVDADQPESGEERQQRGGQLGGPGGDQGTGATQRIARPGPTNGPWGDADWLLCRDGKWRPVEPGTFPLAHGATSRVGRLRAYGNAIVAPLAQEFVEATMGFLRAKELFDD